MEAGPTETNPTTQYVHGITRLLGRSSLLVTRKQRHKLYQSTTPPLLLSKERGDLNSDFLSNWQKA